MKRKLWVKRGRDGSYFYLGSEGTKPGRFPPFSSCHYPDSNVNTTSDKRMETDSIYVVKEIMFKVTKSYNGFTTGLPKATHGIQYFRISGCYIFLGKKLSNKETSPPLPDEYGIIRHQGNISTAHYRQIIQRPQQYRQVFDRYRRNEPPREEEGDQS